MAKKRKNFSIFLFRFFFLEIFLRERVDFKDLLFHHHQGSGKENLAIIQRDIYIKPHHTNN